MPIEPGHVIAGKYRIVEQLGRGGMGSVWLAEHQLLGSHVAIKVIDYQGGNDDDSVQRRFLQEAQSAAQIRSAHVVQIFDYGLDEGVPFIVMERLVGETLGSRLGREEVLDPELAGTIFTQIGRAVQKAHDSGIVHRDLKPENVFLVKDEEGVTAKVLDFGIAKASRKPDPSHETTATGVLLGSPLYMSPEQAHGGKALDHRSDLWSLAVMVFESLTGRVPFRGQGWGELVAQICRDKPPVPSTIRPVPEGFDAWFEKAAERNPDRRFQSCREFMEALRPLLSPTNGVVKFVSTVPPAPLADTEDANGTSSDSTLDMRDPRARGDSGPKTPEAVVTTLRSTTGGVASSDRPPQRASRRGLAVLGLVAAAAIGFALFRQQLPAQTSGGSASATRPPEPRVSSAPMATSVPTEAALAADAAPPSEAPAPSESAAPASLVTTPPVASPPASSAREAKAKTPSVRPSVERGKPGAAPARPATTAPPAAPAAAPAPSDVLKSRE